MIFPSPKPKHYFLLPTLLQIHGLLFSLIITGCIYVCIYIDIPDHNLVNPCNATCIYVLRVRKHTRRGEENVPANCKEPQGIA